GLLVADLEDLVHERTVEDRPDLREADALDLVRSRRTATQDRPLWLDGHAQETRIPRTEEAGDADEGSRRADAGDPGVNRSIHGGGDLGPGRALVGRGIGGVVE